MYTSFYDLSKMPFDITPDPDFLFPGDLHKEAFASVLYGLKSHKGILSLIGEVGTGKTMTLRTLMESAHLKEFRIVYLFNPNMQPREFIAKLLSELDCDSDENMSLNACIDLLADKTVELYRQNSGLIIIIDEAQHVPDETLEFVRLLSNIESNNRKLVQILLAGQPELLTKLQQPHMRQLRQRIVVSAKLNRMTQEQTGQYIVHRLRTAGADYLPFDARAFRRIVETTRGNPRLVNIVCDLSLVNGMGHGKKQIDISIVDDVLRDLESTTLAGVINSETSPTERFLVRKKDRVNRARPVKTLRSVAGAGANPVSGNIAHLRTLTRRVGNSGTPEGLAEHTTPDDDSPSPDDHRSNRTSAKPAAESPASQSGGFWSWLKTGVAGQWVLASAGGAAVIRAAQRGLMS
ncbi:MAG: AAA family ATPase [Granulosicoccus sp.]|nr:AAA family ATPase [Granulosicoccus sp.]